MYPKFTQILQTLAAADTKGLWQRWLRSTPEGCFRSPYFLLLETQQQLYLSYLLIMYLAPSDDFVREHTAWVFSGKDICDKQERYCSSLYFSHKIRKTRRWSQILASFEQIIHALLDDLEALSQLSENDISVWMRCEVVIRDILVRRTTHHRGAIALFNRLRFYTDDAKADDTPYITFMEWVSLEFRSSMGADLRWRTLACAKMQELVLQESRGVVLQPASCPGFGIQYIWSLYHDTKRIRANRTSGQYRLICIDYDVEVHFVAQLNLFAKHSSVSRVVQMIDTVDSNTTLKALLDNLLLIQGEQPGLDWQIGSLDLCMKLGAVIEFLKDSFTKDQYAQLAQIHRELRDRAEQTQQPKDIAKAMKRLHTEP